MHKIDSNKYYIFITILIKMNLKSAVEFIVSVENIRSKHDLDTWCGDMGRLKLYLYAKRLAPAHWDRIETPENSVRAIYQKMLTGYKIFNH
jgi:hypothetical protein